MKQQVIVLGALLISAPVHAELRPFLKEGEWKAEAGVQFRTYSSAGDQGQATSDLALRFQGDYFYKWNDRPYSMEFTPYVVVDQQDAQRNHLDLREAFWREVGDKYEIKAGISRVTWGKTEFVHIVDVVNQLDFTEGSKDEKLGQPMLAASLQPSFGYIDLYLMPVFRERTFAGPNGRLRTPIVVDASHAEYDHGNATSTSDIAARWHDQVTDELEVAISWFSGIDREPSFIWNFDVNDPALLPYYHHKRQIGLEMEYMRNGWVGKLEAISVDSDFQSYNAADAGLEYTWSSIVDSDIDATLITEYLWDQRGSLAPSVYEHDVGVAMRFSFNDVEATEVLVGGLFDVVTSERCFNIEASRRVSDDIRLKLTALHVQSQRVDTRGLTLVDSYNRIMDSGVFNTGLDMAQLADRLGHPGITDPIALLTAVSGAGALTSAATLDTMHRLVELTDTSHKLGMFQSDNYIQVELTYFY